MLAPQLMPKNLPFHAFVLANNYYFVGKHDDEVHNTSDDGGNCYVSQDGRIPIRNTILRLFCHWVQFSVAFRFQVWRVKHDPS
jgi:hypothetical protein